MLKAEMSMPSPPWNISSPAALTFHVYTCICLQVTAIS
jgi:hypothetical protein